MIRLYLVAVYNVIIKARRKWWILWSQPGFHCGSYIILRWLFRCRSQSVHLNPHVEANNGFPAIFQCSHLQSFYDFNPDNVVPLKDWLKNSLYFKWTFPMWTHVHMNRRARTHTYPIDSQRDKKPLAYRYGYILKQLIYWNGGNRSYLLSVTQ